MMVWNVILTDHPRIRGEHVPGRPRRRLAWGSSPHTRGAPDHHREPLRVRRIIPAYAGSTPPARGHPWPLADHPRIRGEHANNATLWTSSDGSSPHTRGAPRTWQGSADLKRIIPAYAGSTSPAPAGQGPAPDHPRIRGEHVHVGPPALPGVGSSPHTRGAHPVHDPGRPADRIIPAYAGSTCVYARALVTRLDHPRIRGEHESDGGGSVLRVGSSPHTRGALSRISRSDPVPRIIPAYAGSTSPSSTSPSRRPDHPRIRGEHADKSAPILMTLGSSPHTRGAQACECHYFFAFRIIPAYAGSTRPGRGRPAPHRDHPRIRGEHWGGVVDCVVVGGSSPHTRGALASRTCKPSWPRIIPAYAGSTSR